MRHRSEVERRTYADAHRDDFDPDSAEPVVGTLRRMSMYDEMMSTPLGRMRMAAARLDAEMAAILEEAFRRSGRPVEEVAAYTGFPAEDIELALEGNSPIPVRALTWLLEAMGFELAIKLEPTGTFRPAGRTRSTPASSTDRAASS